MRFATFNANSIRSRQEVVLQWIRDRKPDVLCVQETKVQDAEFPVDAFRDAGLHLAFSGQKAYNGVAVFSPHPIETVRAGFDDAGPPDAARLLHVRVADIDIIDTYVPQGREIAHEMYAYKLEWFERLRSYFSRHLRPDRPAIWTGDLNVAAEPIDVHAPENYAHHVCFHEDVRRAFSRCRDWGFVDVFRALHPEPGLYTFFDYRTPNAAKRGIGWRIDYILATQPLAARCIRSGIDLEPRLQPKASDHTFLWAEFEQ